MNEGYLRKTLGEFREGILDEEEVLSRLRDLPYQDLHFAKVDHHRHLRQGFPEVIFGESKTPKQILAIADSILGHSPNLLVTRTTPEVAERLAGRYPECRYHPECRAVTVVRQAQDRGRASVGVFCAGTSDIAVAEEAALTARVMGNQVRSSYDVGVAGLHRILGERQTLQGCSVAVVVAGMEGALPSVVGGLTDIPVIAVPTSVGYGASFRGLSALLAMLNSCSANVSVVNIDNGFGAGYVASLINRKREGD